jgi:hypothetical protein
LRNYLLLLRIFSFDFFIEHVENTSKNDYKHVQNTLRAPKSHLNSIYQIQLLQNDYTASRTPRTRPNSQPAKMQASEVDDYVKRQIQVLKGALQAQDNI